MSVAVVNFQRAGHFTFFPQQHHKLRMDHGAAGFQVVFDDDFAVANAFLLTRLSPYMTDQVSFAPYADVMAPDGYR